MFNLNFLNLDFLKEFSTLFFLLFLCVTLFFRETDSMKEIIYLVRAQNFPEKQYFLRVHMRG